MSSVCQASQPDVENGILSTIQDQIGAFADNPRDRNLVVVAVGAIGLISLLSLVGVFD
tara:strand:+ start:385 stop:558 length:174 start_codon:yes stop_codon:yes gene_type:complete